MILARDLTGTNSRGLRPDCGAGAGRTFGRQAASSVQRKIHRLPVVRSHSVLSARGGTFGNCPAQGPVRGPGYADLDLSLQKNFLFTEASKLQFRGGLPQCIQPREPQHSATSLGDNMGLVNTSQNPRVIQFALKLYY